MHTDPIADLLTRIRNSAHSRKSVLHAPYSKIKEAILEVLKTKGFIEQLEVNGEGKEKEITITLKQDKTLHLQRISTPGKRMYIKHANIRKPRSGLGINIVSTSQGIMSGDDARKKNLGGELLCEIY